MAKQNVTAIIYNKRGKVLSIGKNSYVHSCKLQRYHAVNTGNPKAVYNHAEIDSINRCPDLTKAHRIVVTRVLKSGKTALAKPCKICQSAIDASGIKITEYSIDD